MTDTDPFSPAEFDPWAATYDDDVAAERQFPFEGYRQVLATVLRSASLRPGMTVIDVGTGTGNLAALFTQQGCELWCTDFSEAMLAEARRKLPRARFVLHDLRAPLPAELARRFDRIVSGYVFHHFELAKKVHIARELATGHLAPDGRLIIADLSFPSRLKMEEYATAAGALWEEEPYWLADESLPALLGAGSNAQYEQVSPCAGVYMITAGG